MAIYCRKNKKGENRYTVVPEYTGPNGKRIRKGCKTFSFEQMADIWLEAIKINVAPSTFDGYKRIVVKYLIPFMAKMKVQAIKSSIFKKVLCLFCGK